MNERQVAKHRAGLKNISDKILDYTRRQSDRKSLALISDKKGLIRARTLKQLIGQLTVE